MLEMLGRAFQNCDRIVRRDALKVGALALGGIGLPELLRRRALAAVGAAPPKDTAVIQIFLGGGPSHLDTYDLKPNAPAEFRGEFRDIATSVPGIRISEHLPLQAAIMDKLAVVRSARHAVSAHQPASHLMQTGYPGQGISQQNTHPSCGSIVAKLRGPNQPGLPPYTAVPRQASYGLAAYLGAAYNPFITDVEPNAQSFHVQSLKLTSGITAQRLENRRSLLQQFDSMRRDVDLHGDLVGLDSFSRDAIALVTSDRAAQAFDINAEDARTRDRYGRTSIGQNCLLARRLVEAGVTYVACLSGGGWDTHANNFSELKKVSLPRYDRAIAALVSDLHERGLDKKVLVIAFGEFGRTPRINPSAGRDHWPDAMSYLFAGGGLKMGQMVGETDSRGAYPISKPLTPGCLLATMYHTLGIDYHHEFPDQSGRPIRILSEGQAIADLI